MTRSKKEAPAEHLTYHSPVVLNILTVRVILLLYNSSSNTIIFEIYMVLSEIFENYIFFKTKTKAKVLII